MRFKLGGLGGNGEVCVISLNGIFWRGKFATMIIEGGAGVDIMILLVIELFAVGW